MNPFNGKLELQSVSPVSNEPNRWDIVASFIDNLGVFYASDTLIDDIVYNDGSPINVGILRYKIVYIDVLTDFSTLYARIEWAMPDTNYVDPLGGFEAFVGRPSLGVVFLPSVTIQTISEGFLQYARNIESWFIAKYSYLNRVINGSFSGDQDGSNVVFNINENILPETLVVKYNGIVIQKDLEYAVDGNNVILITAPTTEDTLGFDYNKL